MAVSSLLIGAGCGVLSAFGIGGGSLLMVWLTAAAGYEPPEAAMINLLFFLPASSGGLLFHCKHGLVEKQMLLPAIICGCGTAFVGIWLGRRIPLEFLRPVFGAFLVTAGIKEIRKSRGK